LQEGVRFAHAIATTAEGLLKIELEAGNRVEILQVSTITGKTLLNRKVHNRQSSLNLPGFPDGTYLLRFVGPDTVFTRRIFKY